VHTTLSPSPHPANFLPRAPTCVRMQKNLSGAVLADSAKAAPTTRATPTPPRPDAKPARARVQVHVTSRSLAPYRQYRPGHVSPLHSRTPATRPRPHHALTFEVAVLPVGRLGTPPNEGHHQQPRVLEQHARKQTPAHALLQKPDGERHLRRGGPRQALAWSVPTTSACYPAFLLRSLASSRHASLHWHSTYPGRRAP
jgi:hypothetical protein